MYAANFLKEHKTDLIANLERLDISIKGKEQQLQELKNKRKQTSAAIKDIELTIEKIIMPDEVIDNLVEYAKNHIKTLPKLKID